MDIMPIIRAASFGICFYAGIYHFLVGLRRKPIDRIHLTFAFTALAFAFRNFGEILFNSAASGGRLNDYLFWGHLAVTGYILGLIFLTWFVAIYTKVKPLFIPLAVTLAWLILLGVHQNSPYFYLFTEEPVFIDVTLPWGEVVTYGDAKMSRWADMEWIIILTMLTLFIYASIRQYLRGERREALMLGVAVTIFLGSYVNDMMLDYDMINSLYILAQGFVVMIVMMSMTLSNEIIYTENALEALNVELEQRVGDRTAELSSANRDLHAAKEAADAANRAKSVFLSNMSHELRTPLNAILGHAQIMSRDSSLTSEQLHGVESVNRSGDHLLTLINSVLEMSKIEAGQATVTLSSFSIDSLISDLQIMFGDRVKAKGLEFVVDKDPHIISSIEADRGKISQILVNLLANAVRHTLTGVITLRAATKTANGEAPDLILEVQDTGTGIAAQDLERIFDPFVQSDAGSEEQTGTGLGLAISRQYAQLMEGELSVQSQVGQGSTFRLTVPVTEAKSLSHETSEMPHRKVVGIAGDNGPYRVLVVDDEPSNREVLIGMLSPADFDIREAGDGREAIAQFESWSPHLIFMDIRMPVMDGIEATQAIKLTDQGRSTPIIGVSASVFKEDQVKVLDSGADDFIAKPVQEAELWEKIGKCLNVEVLFEDHEPMGGDRPDQPSLTKTQLEVLPGQLVEEMRKALLGGYMDRLAELAKTAAGHQPEISQQLLKLVDRYDYETLYRLFLEDVTNEGKTDDLA